MKPCSAAQKVVIIGAGPAGLEAARSAALRGAKVTLVEKSGRLGGTARLIASPDWKYRFRQFFDWYALQLKKLGVEVLLNTELTADSPILEDAERIFVATGLQAHRPAHRRHRTGPTSLTSSTYTATAPS